MFLIPKVSKIVATAGRQMAAVSTLSRCFSQITVPVYIWINSQYGPSQAFIRQPAPTFKAPAVVDNDITTVNLEDYKGEQYQD